MVVVIRLSYRACRLAAFEHLSRRNEGIQGLCVREPLTNAEYHGPEYPRRQRQESIVPIWLVGGCRKVFFAAQPHV